MIFRRASRTLAGPLAAALAFGAALPSLAAEAVDEAMIAEQRALFLAVYEPAERGDWGPVEALDRADRERLSAYLLWPDLRAAYLRAVLHETDTKVVNDYLAEYGTLKPARELRYRYALALAGRNDLEGFRDVYDAFYQGRGIARLDCIALRAEIDDEDRERSVAQRAQDLWLVAQSQVDECDPLFDQLKARGLIGTEAYRQRYALAIEARNFTLAHWLGKSIDDEHAAVARRWLAAQSDPERFLKRHADPDAAVPRLAEQIAYAVERLTYADPVRARAFWAPVRDRLDLDEDARIATDRHIALWTARDRLPGAYELLTALDDATRDTEVKRWLARTSLREGAWTRLVGDIAQFDAVEGEREEWRYWHAVALARTGRGDEARVVFDALARERSFYGFLAADAIGAPYALATGDGVIDEALVAELATREALLRARELYRVGLDGRGRSEWDSAVRQLTPAEQYHAAVLADRWDWHSRAIATVAAIGEYDDLGLRYPLPFRDEFEQHANSASIETTWAYGIARSESLFMRDVRSSAGAIGLMQLMPATGRRVARAIDLPYAGIDTLTDPVDNIRLGTTYLRQMADRYDGNTVLATAAYNAGPRRVDAWLPSDVPMAATAWIETIPFNETRRYVRRVKAAQAIFHWRMTGEVRRLSDILTDVAPRDDARVAQRLTQ